MLAQQSIASAPQYQVAAICRRVDADAGVERTVPPSCRFGMKLARELIPIRYARRLRASLSPRWHPA